MTAILPVLLAGALPTAVGERSAAAAETLTHIDAAIAGLPPSAQTELAQLFALLALPPARIAFAINSRICMSSTGRCFRHPPALIRSSRSTVSLRALRVRLPPHLCLEMLDAKALSIKAIALGNFGKLVVPRRFHPLCEIT